MQKKPIIREGKQKPDNSFVKEIQPIDALNTTISENYTQSGI